MLAVLHSTDFRPLTVIDLPPERMEALANGQTIYIHTNEDFKTLLRQGPLVENDGTIITPTELGWSVRIRCVTAWAGDTRLPILVTDTEAAAVRLAPALLPGQSSRPEYLLNLIYRRHP